MPIEEKAYLKKIIKYIPDHQDRKWIGPFEIIPYKGMREERLVIYGLEGSPMRGFVVFNYGTGNISAYDINGRRVKNFDLLTDFIKDL